MKKRRKSGKGELIKGMSKLWPGSLMEDPAFEIEMKELMKKHSGIYSLYKNKKLYYVGLAKDLHQRIIDHHEKDRHANKWNKFKIFRIKRVRYLKDLETLILHIAGKPKGNRNNGQIPPDANLNRFLRSVVRKKEKELRAYKRALR